MSTITAPTPRVRNYHKRLTNLSREEKIYLMECLRTELAQPSGATNAEATDKSTSFIGAWQGDDTAEEFMQVIREHRSLGRQPIHI